MKKFLISVDTEGDNLWQWKLGDPITTENTKYILRFQDLCEKYGFVPTYLTNYEMAMDECFVTSFREKYKQGKCEIGMHLHAWNTPPEYQLENIYGENPFITEYPKEVILEKHRFLKKLLEERFQMPIVSYRSGRWATNEALFEVLEEIGIIVDCSVTPGITHAKIRGQTVSGGNDYLKSPQNPYLINEKLVELPMTTCRKRSLSGSTIKNKIHHLLTGDQFWLRPIGTGYENLMKTRKYVERNNNAYLMFMIHSSELMPGGSPYFRDECAVENLFFTMENFFDEVSKEYEGISVGKYGLSYLNIEDD